MREVKMDSSDLNATIKAGKLLLSDGQYADANRILQTAWDSQEPNIKRSRTVRILLQNILRLNIESAAGLKDIEAAKLCVERCKTNAMHGDICLFLEGKALTIEGRYKEALEIYSQIGNQQSKTLVHEINKLKSLIK